MRLSRKAIYTKLMHCKVEKGKVKVYRFGHEILFGKWKHKRDVTMLTNFDNFTFSKVTNQRGYIQEKPNVVINYNQIMRGVNVLNQHYSYYR